MNEPSLDDVRAEIDTIDRRLIDLLAERMERVAVVGALKSASPDGALHDPDRERRVFRRWAEHGAERGLAPYFLGRVLHEVLGYSRRDQERRLRHGSASGEATGLTRVAFQGAVGAHSELALQKLWSVRDDTRLQGVGHRRFADALDALAREEVDYALLPVENTLYGSIDEVYRLLGEHRVHVVDEETLRIEHVLCALPGTRIEDLRAVRSHPVALEQCRRLLGGLVGVTAEAYWDTAGAARSVAEEGRPDVGALCSETAAAAAGLEVLVPSAGDSEHNQTRFLLLGREPERPDPRVPARTSLLVTLGHRQGALAHCLSAFAAHGVNLTKLESRPVPDSPWEYLFYLDVEGAVGQPDLDRALEIVAAHTNQLRVLGSYPRRVEERIDDAPDDALGRAAVEVREPDPPAAPALPRVPERRVVSLGGHAVGAGGFTLIAGPCAVESRDQMRAAAQMVRAAGGHALRGGAFKPRTSPKSFQGLGFEGLAFLEEAGRAIGLPVVTEVLRPEDVERVAEHADVLQVGARNMQNFELLKELGRVRRPILLKRGMSATVDEWVKAADYLLDGGNRQVILCERGIRTFETATRATLDVSSIPVLRERTALPVIVDPSHAAGRRELVVPLALAAAAAGADGLIVEVHPCPDEALCDGPQALTREDLDALVARLHPILASRQRTG